MPTKTKNEVAVKEEMLPAEMLNYGEDAGKGYENQTASDLSLPWWNILQDGSPQVKEKGSSCRAGQLFNTVTGEVVDGEKGLLIIPVEKRTVYVEWIPRDNGGGFVATHDPESPIVKQAVADSTKYGKYSYKGNDLVETFELYFLILDQDNPESEVPIGFGVTAFTSKKIKPFKNWNTSLNLVNYRAYKIPSTPPIFANRVRLKSEQQTHKNYIFENVVLEPMFPDTAELPGIIRSLVGFGTPLYTKAKDLREMIQAGVKTADYSTQSQEVHGEEADDRF
jgi:hypothetical protein